VCAAGRGSVGLEGQRKNSRLRKRSENCELILGHFTYGY
jgi:hypothetical protein